MLETIVTPRGRAVAVVDCAQCLRTHDCWPLTPAARTGVSVTRVAELAPGDSLWQQGDPFRGLHIVTRGSVKLVEKSPDGTERIAGFRFAGDLIGLGALADGVHEDDAVALETLSVCRLLWDRNAESDSFSALDRELLARQAQELRLLRAQRQLAASSAVEAVSGCLTHITAMIRRGAAEAAREPQAPVRLPMSGAELANYLGLAEETLSRALRTLEQRGQLWREGRALRWLDPPCADATQAAQGA